ncbi:MAG TPA: hypothetical protein VF258_10705, partial [Luteolibacter sp.]
LSFKGRYREAPENSPTGLRFGLINPADPDASIYAHAGTGGGTGFGLSFDTAGDKSPGTANKESLESTHSGSAFKSLDATAFDASFSIKRVTDSEYEVSVTVGEATRTATTDKGFNNIQSFFIRNGGIKADFLVDSVTVSKIP